MLFVNNAIISTHRARQTYVLGNEVQQIRISEEWPGGLDPERRRLRWGIGQKALQLQKPHGTPALQLHFKQTDNSL